MKKTITICTVVAAAVVGAETYLPNEGDIDVSVYQTTGDRAFREVLTTPFTPHAYTNRVPVDVDVAETRGRYQWLGVSLTDASAWLLSHLPAEKRAAILKAVFSSTEGAALSGVRLNIGASDYSTAIYNYNENDGDIEMTQFSMARDDNWIFPMAREIMKVNPATFFFGAEWSCPGWMKTTGNFIDGHLKAGYEPALANYLAAYVEGCKVRGIPLKAVSINNEAGLSTRGTYPALVISPEQEARTAIALRRRLAAKGLSCEIWGLDWNYNHANDRVRPMLAVPGAAEAFDAIAWHSYTAGAENIWALKKDYPALKYYHTEQGPARHDPSRTAKWWAKRVQTALENGCEGFTGWNLCLDEYDMPLTGPHLCAGLVTADSETGDFTLSQQYHLFRHIGPYVKSGAEVLRYNADADLDDLAVLLFRNPDGSIVLVAACESGHGQTGRTKADGTEPRPKLYIRYKGEYKHLPLPFGTWSVTTVVFRAHL